MPVFSAACRAWAPATTSGHRPRGERSAWCSTTSSIGRGTPSGARGARQLPPFLCRPRALEETEHGFRRHGQSMHPGTHSVVYGVGHAAAGSDAGGSPTPLTPRGPVLEGCSTMMGSTGGMSTAVSSLVVEEVGVEYPAFAHEHFLHQPEPESHGHAALYLPFHGLGVDGPAHVVRGGQLRTVTGPCPGPPGLERRAR